jgi:uncharacterized protein
MRVARGLRLGVLSLSALGALPLPIWGEGWGEGVTGQTERPKPLTPTLSLWEREQTDLAVRPAVKSPLATTGRARCTLIVSFALFFFTLLPAFALDFPTLSGRVVDDANILDEPTRTALTQKLADLETKSTDQLVVVTLKSLQGTSIEDFGVQLGRKWQIGQKDKNNGVLLIVAPTERKVRIEVGYGLEGTLTDAITRLIIENGIVPRFRANDFPGGITRGVDDIISVLTGDAEEWKQRAAKRPDTVTQSPSTQSDSIWPVIWLVLIVIGVIVLCAMFAGALCFEILRFLAIMAMSGGGGGGSRSSGGGGGFSGGGGSFGGGGSSGSW